MVPFRLNHLPLAAWTVNHSDITAPRAGSGHSAQFLNAIALCNPTELARFGRMSRSILLQSPSVSSCCVRGFVRAAATSLRGRFRADATAGDTHV